MPGFWPLFPTLGIVDKRCVVASIEFDASLIGEVLSGFGGVRRLRLMAGMGISIVLIQLMARWSSGAVLLCKVLRQFEVVKSEALQDKRLLHYLQQEVARFQDIEDVEVKDSGYMMNSSFAWCAGFVGVAGECSDSAGVFGAKNNAVPRRKARSN